MLRPAGQLARPGGELISHVGKADQSTPGRWSPTRCLTAMRPITGRTQHDQGV